MQRSAQEYHLARDGPTLSQARDGLVHHCLEDGRGHVFLPPALVQDGLDVRLGKHAAPGGNGIDLLIPGGQGVQIVDGHVHQGCHLVDKGSGASGAGPVHPFLQRAAEEDDLGVLAPQLHHGVCAGQVPVHGLGCGEDLLDKVHPGGFCHAQTGRAGDHRPHRAAGNDICRLAQQLAGLFSDLGKMPLIAAEQKVSFRGQDHHFHSGGANVNANVIGHSWYLL